MVMTTCSLESVQGRLEIVQRATTGPAPVTWVNVALGVVLSGLKVPVPPLTTDQLPVPTMGVLPPNPAVVPLTQIDCGSPTIAIVGFGRTVTVMVLEAHSLTHVVVLSMVRDEYVVVEVGLTDTEVPVANGEPLQVSPVNHSTVSPPAPGKADSVLLPPAQIVDELACRSVGAEGMGLTVTTTLPQLSDQHPVALSSARM